MGYPQPITDPNALMEQSQDPLTQDFRTRLRVKAAIAIEMALDVCIAAMEGKRSIKPIQIQAAKLVMPFAPHPSHGSAPITLVLPAIPRPGAMIENSAGQPMAKIEIVDPGAS